MSNPCARLAGKNRTAASGSATVNALFPESAVRYQGDISTIRLTADSDNTAERAELAAARSRPATAPPAS